LASIGLNAPGWRLRQFLTAFIAGAVLVALWALIVAGLSSSRPKLAEGVGRAALPGLLIFYVFNNAAEELAYRAYAFLALEKAYGRFIAIVGTSAAFTLMHMQGGMPWLQALAGTLTNALIFGMLFYRWKSLPLTLGFHLATNVMQDVLGLRQSALTLLSWTRVDTSGARGVAILILVAAINLSVVAFLGRVKGTKHG
jgi:membrane protease YdiL (CAAX protease family)